jgi:hypothetical protein
MRPISLLHLPNEEREGDQVGPRQAFAELHREGLLAHYEAFSFLVEAAREGAPAALDRLLRLVAGSRPDLLVWQHVGGFPVTPRFLADLRAASPGTHLLCHEGDVYGRRVKRLPPETRALFAAADTVALVGAGEYAELARAAGARRVLYSPHSADTVRFGLPWTPTPERELDVAMIGSRVTSRRPWARLPGARAREALVRALARRFGARFALYGQGWAGFASDRGPLAFDEQERAQRRARVTVSWDHFDTVERYFSDRVPIALLSGVPHVTNRQPGYEEVFGPGAPLAWADTVDGVVAEVERLLALGQGALDELGRRAAVYARGRFTARVVYERLVREALAGGGREEACA